MPHTRHTVNFAGSRVLLSLLLFGSLIISGCAGKSKPPNLYILAALSEQQAAVQPDRSARQLLLGIGPLTLADYLDQPRLVTRSGDYQLIRNEFEQWGGSFKKNITAVLADNIGYLVQTEQLYVYPWQRSISPDFQVTVNIIRFDGILNEEVTLVARWSIFDGQGKALIQTRRSTVVEPVDGNGYPALVSAQSRALGTLSREIAETVLTESGR